MTSSNAPLPCLTRMHALFGPRPPLSPPLSASLRRAKQLRHECDWHESGERSAGFKAQRLARAAESREVAAANALLLERRRERLRAVLNAEREQCAAELAALGLAVYS